MKRRGRLLAVTTLLLVSVFILPIITAMATEGEGYASEDPNPIVTFEPTAMPATPTPPPTPEPTVEPSPGPSADVSPEPGTPGPNSSGLESQPPESSGLESSGLESSGVESSGLESSGLESSGVESSGIDEGTVDDPPDDSGNNDAPITVVPSPLATPIPSIERPTVQLDPNASQNDIQDDSVSAPNYITFAKLNMRNNSMAITLFYSGIGCIATGSLGLLTLIILSIRGRKYTQDERDGIFAEIEEAENRNHTAGGYPPYVQQLTADDPPRQEYYQERPAAPPGSVPLKPTAASVYTEEFALEEDGYAPPVSQSQAAQQRPVQQVPQQRPAAQPQAQQRPVQQAPQQRPAAQPQAQQRPAQQAPQQRPAAQPQAQQRPVQQAPRQRPAAQPQAQQRSAQQDPPRNAVKQPPNRQNDDQWGHTPVPGQLSFNTDELLKEILHKDE